MLAREQEIREVENALSMEKIKSVLLFYHHRRRYLKGAELRTYDRLGGYLGSVRSIPTDTESTINRSQPMLENSAVPQIIVQDDNSSIPMSSADRLGRSKLSMNASFSTQNSASFNLSAVSYRSRNEDDQYDDEYDEKVMESIRNSQWFK